MCLRTRLTLLLLQCLSLACCCFSRGPSEKNPPAHNALGPLPPWFPSWGRDSAPRVAVKKVPSCRCHVQVCEHTGQEGTWTKVGHQEPPLFLWKDSGSVWKGRERDRDSSELSQQGAAVRSFTFCYSSTIWYFLQLKNLPKTFPQIWRARLRDPCVVLGGLGNLLNPHRQGNVKIKIIFSTHTQQVNILCSQN